MARRLKHGQQPDEGAKPVLVPGNLVGLDGHAQEGRRYLHELGADRHLSLLGGSRRRRSAGSASAGQHESYAEQRTEDGHPSLSARLSSHALRGAQRDGTDSTAAE